MNVMNKLSDQTIEKIREYHLPKYREIPDVGLYLDQVVHYVDGILSPLAGVTVTGSMISNYVKKKLLANPVKKTYRREQIAYILFIGITKTVLSLEDIQSLIEMQVKSYDIEVAYEYFCAEFKDAMLYVFEQKEKLDEIGEDNTVEKKILQATIRAAVHKIYLDQFFAETKSADTAHE